LGELEQKMKKVKIQFNVGGGVFSHLLILLNNIAVYIRDNVISKDDIIYVEGRRPTEQHPLFGPLPFNFFDRIFEQSIDNEYTTLNNIVGHPVLLEDLNRDIILFREASKLLKFNPNIVKIVEKFYEDNIRTPNILGVHIRMTDMNTIHPWLGLVTVEDYCREIDMVLSKHKIEKIYLATDNREDARKIAARYGSIVVWRDSKYIMENSGDDHQIQVTEKKFYTDPQFFDDCIIDSLILMKSKFLIGRISTLNYFVQSCHISNIEKYYHITGMYPSLSGHSTSSLQMDTILWFGPWKDHTIRDIIGKDDQYLIHHIKRHFVIPQELNNYINTLQ
jgi:hypothetical protein